MGMTANQARATIQMIAQEFDPLAAKDHALQLKAHEEVLNKWNADGRVVHFANAYERALGAWDTTTSFSSPWDTSGAKDKVVNSIIQNWNYYTAGKAHGELYDAMADAGFTGDLPKYVLFSHTNHAVMLETALRTTKKHWGTLSDSYANLIIELKTALNVTEAFDVVERFLDSLK